jgi:hypothetical protein
MNKLTKAQEKLRLTGDKTYEFFLPPKIIKAIGGKGKWHLGIVEEKGSTTRYYLDGVEKEKIDCQKLKDWIINRRRE